MKEQLLETWRINNHMNLLFLNEIPVEALTMTLSKRGGRTVFQQFIHVLNIRIQWLEIAAKGSVQHAVPLEKETEAGKELLQSAFIDTGKSMEDFISNSWDQGGVVKSFKKGLIPFIGYFIAHEAHHRGHALLTIKQLGGKLSDKLKWGLWDWQE